MSKKDVFLIKSSLSKLDENYVKKYTKKLYKSYRKDIR